MSDGPKRRWFQFSLETVLIIVMTLAIGLAQFRYARIAGSVGWTYWLATIALCLALLDLAPFRGVPRVL